MLQLTSIYYNHFSVQEVVYFQRQNMIDTPIRVAINSRLILWEKTCHFILKTLTSATYEHTPSLIVILAYLSSCFSMGGLSRPISVWEARRDWCTEFQITPGDIWENQFKIYGVNPIKSLKKDRRMPYWCKLIVVSVQEAVSPVLSVSMCTPWRRCQQLDGVET